jgi:DNA-binding response OmpR family regulator
LSGRRQPLGQLLVKRQVVQPTQLRDALAAQAGTGQRVASALLAQGAADEHSLLETLSLQVGVPGISVAGLVLPLRFLDVLPQSTAASRKVLPVWVDRDRIFLAAADPGAALEADGAPDLEAELAFLERKHVVICVALASPLEALITEAYEAKGRGELELRGSETDANSSVELSLVQAEEVTHVPLGLLPEGEPSAGASPPEAPVGRASSIEIDLTGDEQDGDLAVNSMVDIAEIMTAEPADEASVRARVLVVDDDEDLARLISRLLVSRGLEVQQAYRGLAALAAIKAAPPELVILDAMLPELHGFDIAQKIKQSERYQHIPVVMMSSVYRGWRIAEDLKDSYGVEAFLEKPFNLDVLWKTVDRVLIAARGGARRRMPSSAQRAYRDGLERFRAQDIDGAIAALKQAIASDPLAAKLHFQLGVLYLKKRGMIYQAMQAFEEAVQLQADFFAALRSLAILYQRKGFKNKAVDMWERALRCSPDGETAEQMRKHLMNLL